MKNFSHTLLLYCCLIGASVKYQLSKFTSLEPAVCRTNMEQKVVSNATRGAQSDKNILRWSFFGEIAMLSCAYGHICHFNSTCDATITFFFFGQRCRYYSSMGVMFPSTADSIYCVGLRYFANVPLFCFSGQWFSGYMQGNATRLEAGLH